MKFIDVGKYQKAQVDDNDFSYLSQLKWRLSGTGYAVTDFYKNGKRILVPMHRLILDVKDSKTFVDHADRNILNNSRSNLRICTNSLNQANRPKNKNRKHLERFKGVYFRPRKKAFVAYVSCAGNKFYLGFYKKEVEAAKAYNEAAKSLFGEFALLNEINQGGVK